MKLRNFILLFGGRCGKQGPKKSIKADWKLFKESATLIVILLIHPRLPQEVMLFEHTSLVF